MNQNSRLTPHLALPSEATLSHLSELNGLRLSPHFTLGELCKTKYVTADGNIPSRAVIENLIRVCGWLEELRVVAGVRPRSKVGCAVDAGVRPQSKVGCAVVAGVRPQSKVASDCTLAPDPGAAPEAGEAIVINSGYRSPEVNRLAGGVPSSNHVTGCAVDIRCAGKEQMIRYAAILPVRPKDNRRKIAFLKV